MIEEQTYDTLIQQFTTTFASNSVTVVPIEGANIYDKPSFCKTGGVPFSAVFWQELGCVL